MEFLAYGLTPFKKRGSRGLLGTGREKCELFLLLSGYRRVRAFTARQYEGQ